MKKNLIITLLIAILLSLSSTFALAVSVQDISESSITEDQKTELLMLIASADSTQIAEVSGKFEPYQAQALLNKQAEEAQAELKAKADAELADAWNGLVDLIKSPDVSREEACSIASTYADTVGHEDHLSGELALRYHLEGDFQTIESVQIVISRQNEIKKVVVSKTASLVTANAMLVKELGKVKAQVAQNTAGIAANTTNINEQDFAILTLVKMATDTNPSAYEAALKSTTPVVEEEATPPSE